MQSKAKTVAQYLKELPNERREIVSAVRAIILKNLDDAFEEGMQYGMIGYYVPHSVYPDGYHCDPKQPLPFACLASQKNHLSLYLMSAYGEGLEEDWFRREWAKTGKKLDMGKCCVRFKKLDDLALDVIGEAIKRVTARDYVARYVEFLQSYAAQRGKPKKAAVSKSAVKKGTKKSVALPKAKKKTSVKKASPKKHK